MQNRSWLGQALLIRMRMRRVLRMITAPILSKVSLMRFGLAVASKVSFSALMRSPSNRV